MKKITSVILAIGIAATPFTASARCAIADRLGAKAVPSACKTELCEIIKSIDEYIKDKPLSLKEELERLDKYFPHEKPDTDKPEEAPDTPEENIPTPEAPEEKPEHPDTDTPSVPSIPEEDTQEPETPNAPTEPAVPDTEDKEEAPEAPSGISEYALEVARLVNAERAKYGLAPLTYSNTALHSAAQKRAVETKTLFSHTRPSGESCFTVLAEFGITYRRAGENIAMGQDTPKEVVEDWMNSEGHRANILNADFEQIGIGVYESGGRIYWSQMFLS